MKKNETAKSSQAKVNKKQKTKWKTERYMKCDYEDAEKIKKKSMMMMYEACTTMKNKDKKWKQENISRDIKASENCEKNDNNIWNMMFDEWCEWLW